MNAFSASSPWKANPSILVCEESFGHKEAQKAQMI
jgi:hypothetical protein